METILVVNAGSSSLKFQVFAIRGSQDLNCLVRGQIDGVGMRPRLRAAAGDGTALIDKAFEPHEMPDLEAAIFEAGAWLRETQKVDLVAVGHRVVHGGPDFAGPVRVDGDVIARLERYISLAPLHQPHNLAPMRALLERRPESAPGRLFRYFVSSRSRRIGGSLCFAAALLRGRRKALRLPRPVL